MIIWITGLSGAGKTTIGRALCRLWKRTAPNTVLVDGDEVRRLLGRTEWAGNYTLEARRQVADRIVEFCAWLDRQDMNVVCCTISAFPDLLAANRRRFSRYFEVFLDVPRDYLESGARGDLYAKARRGEVKDVVGIDLPFVEPEAPDLVIQNGSDTLAPDLLAQRIFRQAVSA